MQASESCLELTNNVEASLAERRGLSADVFDFFLHSLKIHVPLALVKT